MTIRREKETLVIDLGNALEELNAFNLEMRGTMVMVLPTRKHTACVYGFNVFSELTTARHLMAIIEAINALKTQGYSVYVSSQARTIFKRINDIKRLEGERINY